MKKLTLEWLKEQRACSTSWFEEQDTTDMDKLFKKAMKAKKYSDINWVLVRLMSKKQKVIYAIFAAEQVIGIFEKKYPNDKRPRQAIEAAKTYVKNPCKKTKDADAAYAYAAYAAAAYAADAYAAAAYAAAAAAAAADAAYAAYAAAGAADAAYAAADAYAAAADAYAAAAREKMRRKILTYGYKLLKEAK